MNGIFVLVKFSKNAFFKLYALVKTNVSNNVKFKKNIILKENKNLFIGQQKSAVQQCKYF